MRAKHWRSAIKIKMRTLLRRLRRNRRIRLRLQLLWLRLIPFAANQNA
jgi:hypothetical protein